MSTTNNTSQTLTDPSAEKFVERFITGMSPDQLATLKARLLADSAKEAEIAGALTPQEDEIDRDALADAAEKIIGALDALEDEGRKAENEEGLDWDVKMLRDGFVRGVFFSIGREEKRMLEKRDYLRKLRRRAGTSEVVDSQIEKHTGYYIQQRRRLKMYQHFYKELASHVSDYVEPGSEARRMSANVLVIDKILAEDGKKDFAHLVPDPITRSRG